MAISYVLYILGKPPDGCELGIMTQDHDYGSYDTIGVWYEYDYPYDYISKSERLIEIFNEAVDWSMISPNVVKDELFEDSEDIDDDEEEA